MIGIITYILVNNRTKEIGILRSVGASKKEVAMIFLSEVLITGASSGVIGIFISNILLFLGNIILRNLDIINQKITLNAGYSVSLILINVVLIMLGRIAGESWNIIAKVVGGYSDIVLIGFIALFILGFAMFFFKRKGKIKIIRIKKNKYKIRACSP